MNNIKREPLTILRPTNPVCKYCGLIHPPLSPGEKCPVAEAEKVGSIEHVNFIAELSNLLKQDKDGILLPMLEKTVAAWKIRRKKFK